MLKENEFMIENSFMNKGNFKIKLTFEVLTMDDSFDYDIETSCSEDIEEVFNLYFKKDWKTLFNEWDHPNSWYRDITDVSFEGIYIVAKEDGKGHVYMRINNSQKVTVSVDLDVMGDKNAAKLKEIRTIINN